MELKNYQKRTLEILKNYLMSAKIEDCKTVFPKYQDAKGYPSEYHPLRDLEEIPYIGLRLPTGGGKTLIGSQTIRIAADNFLEQEFPFVLWLVPSKEIRQQTLKVLRDPQNFYSEILYSNFKGRVKIFDVSEFCNLRPQDLEKNLNIFYKKDIRMKIECRYAETCSIIKNVSNVSYHNSLDSKNY